MEKKIKFCVHPPFEFYYSLIAASFGDECFNELKNENITVEDKLIEIYQYVEETLSTYMKWELKYFFDKDIKFADGLGQMILWGFILDNPSITSIKELLQLIEKSNLPTMFLSIFKYIYYENTNYSVDKTDMWDKAKNNIDLMLNIIKNLEFKNPDRKLKIVECFENPTETKNRFCLVLNQFYDKAFSKYEKYILEKANYIKDEYKKAFNKNPDKFFRDYFKKDITVISGRLNIHISYMLYFGSEYWATGEELEWLTLGIKTIEYLGEQPKKEEIQRFLKAVSDKKRIEMISLLAEKDWYVNEIAEKLNMSAATASYHLSLLQEFDVVDFERYDHRFYYHLDKEKLKEYFEEAARILINE